MAYTNTPEQQTYRTLPVEFDGTTTYRSGDLTIQRDSNIVNMYYDRISQENKQREVFLKKRPGLRATAYDLKRADPTGGIRGHYYDPSENAFYWATGTKVYRVAPDVGTTVRTVATLATSTGFVSFCEFFKASTSTRYICFSDGTDLWIDDYGTPSCAKVTDADLPTPHLPYPVQINGYLCVVDRNTGDIYNSDNDDPTLWTPGNYISAEMVGDTINRLAVNRNYIVAFGKSSLEIFWDAAETSGSPFRRNESGFKDIGYSNGMCQIGNILYFVGQDKNQNLAVYTLDGFKLTRISNEVIERTLYPLTSTDNSKSSINQRDGYSLSFDGHTFYVFVTATVTWMYDIEEKLWYELRGHNGESLKIQAAWGMWEGAQYVAISGETYISMFSPLIYRDFGQNFSCIYTTERINAGSQNWKVNPRLMLRADIHQVTGTSNITIEWSDDDWATVANSRTLNLFSTSPFIHQLGRFRNRSFRFTYAGNYPLRLRGIELDLIIGAH